MWEENCYFDWIVDRSNTLQNNFSISVISGMSFRAKCQLNTCAMIFAHLWLCFCCLHQLVLYSLLLLFFVWEIFKFKYDRFFVRHSASISEFKWFDEGRAMLNLSSWLVQFECFRNLTDWNSLQIPWKLVVVLQKN